MNQIGSSFNSQFHYFYYMNIVQKFKSKNLTSKEVKKSYNSYVILSPFLPPEKLFDLSIVKRVKNNSYCLI